MNNGNRFQGLTETLNPTSSFEGTQLLKIRNVPSVIRWGAMPQDNGSRWTSNVLSFEFSITKVTSQVQWIK
jgi:hypothetical protein